MRVLLSIKPEYANKIMAGDKQYEFRKGRFKRGGIQTIIVYATLPVGKVIGEFSVDDILEGTPESLWEKTHETAGISRANFTNYFANSFIGFAIKVGKVKCYDHPIDINEVSPGLRPP
ncbi:MAG: ASCH domain-containing protein, partial [Desulfatibacillaceae bacterium]|nr:ASCH domain-containing protein [Desulfatibacillaceae bacterium]